MSETQSAGPDYGITVHDHIEKLVREAQELLSGVLRVVRTEKRIPKARRDRLRRDLAGVVSVSETVRVWLDAGCPMVTPPGTAPAAKVMKEEDVPLPFADGPLPACGQCEGSEASGAVVRCTGACHPPLPEPPVSWS